MSIQVSTERLEHNMAKLTITVPAQDFDKACTRAYNKMKNRINVPGFRKGKAPQAIIEKMYGPETFYEDAANIVLPESYEEAYNQVIDEINIVSQPKIGVEQMAKGQDFIYTAEVAVNPEITVEQYKGIEATEVPVEVSDEEIEEEIKSEQKKNSREVTVDRPAEKDDTVVIDYVGSVDGVEFEGGKDENHSLVLGSNSFIPGFEDQLIGSKAGDEVDVNVTFPEKYHAEDLAGKPALFKVKVNEVKTTELPELNDEFAQDVSEFDTFEEYRASVKESLEKDKAESAKHTMEQEAVDKIVEATEMDIPEAMIEYETDKMVQNYEQQMRYSGLSIDMYLQYTGMTMDDLRNQMRGSALKNIQMRLVLEAVARAEGFEASDEDLEKEYETMAKTYNMDAEKVKEIISKEEEKNIRHDIAIRKALDLIGENVVPVPAPEVEETEPEVEEMAQPPKSDEELPE
ncbi:MAG: trigger factor [Lachnospiraceae bacterium]|nr:trigger factor [Lachnospiraceae bacterium]